MENINELRSDLMRRDWKPESIIKVCTICGIQFDTTRKNKNICSWECKQEHNRQHARLFARMKRYSKNGKKEYPPCEVCGYSETTDQHREGKTIHTLCPNHHALISRNLRTLDELLASKSV